MKNEIQRYQGEARGELVREISETFPWGHPAWAPSVPVRAGRLRGPNSMIAADTDCEAVSAWLNETGGNSRKTYDAYRREAERFLLWAAHINKSLSEVLRDDIVEYYEFIKNIPKGSPLLGSKVCRRSNPEWRPFTGSLSKNAQRNTQLILSSLYKYLTDTGWLYADPQPRKKIKSGYAAAPLTRSFEDVQTNAVFYFLYTQELAAETTWQRMNAARDRWIVAICIHLALREGDCTTTTMGDFRLSRHADVKMWELHVVGKGQKEAAIPATEACMDELKRFRNAIGLSLLPEKNEMFPVVPSFRKVWEKKASNVQGIECHPVSTQTIYRRIKAVFSGAADVLHAEGLEFEADQLRAASPHWLRHTSIRDLVASVSDLTIAQKFARHNNVNTTATYAAKTNREVYENLSKRRTYR